MGVMKVELALLFIPNPPRNGEFGFFVSNVLFLRSADFSSDVGSFTEVDFFAY